MAISLKHAFTSNVADSGDNTLVQPSNWNAEHTLTAAADTLLGAITSGPVTEITLTAAGRAILDDADAAAQRTTLGLGSGDSPTFTGLTLSGVGSFSAGTALLPSISTTGDLNTGMWFPAADTLAWSTGGSERMRITSGGGVGIGTSSPADNLDVVGNVRFGSSTVSAVSYTLTLFNGTADTTIFRRYSGGLAEIRQTGGSFQTITQGANPLIFGTTGTERVRIDSSGFLGVGTSTIPAQVSVVGTGQAVSTTLDTAGSLGGSILLGDSGGAGNNGGAIVFSANSTAWRFAAIKGNVTNGGSNTQGDLSFYVRNAAADATLTRAMVISPTGILGVGGSASAGFTITANRNITGSVSGGGFLSNGVIQSDANSLPTYFSAILNTAAGSYTVANPQLFRAVGGSIGAGSAITNLYGYVAGALTAGTTNYNFFGSFPAASVTAGKTAYGYYDGSAAATGGGVTWAFYGAGTAPSYFAGQVQLGAGSVGTPSLAAFGDTNTGMWFPAADTVAWSTGGSERMRITSGGGLGIGVTSPTSILTIGSGTLTAAAVGTSGLYTDASLGLVVLTDGLFVGARGGTGRFQIDTSGNVIVNTAAIATTATNGFLYVPSCAGTPTGTPTTYTGRVPIVVDTTNNKLYFYSGGQWRDAGP